MKYALIFVFLVSCQVAPLLIKEAEEIAVEEAVSLEVRKEKGGLNISLEAKNESTSTQQVNHASSQIREPEGDRGEH